MKLKENKGMSLIVFIIVLAVLVVVAGGIIVYLLNNPVKEKVVIQNQSGIQSNLGSIETNVEIIKEKMTSDEKYNIYLKNLKNNLLKMKGAGENKVDKYLFISEENFTLENNKIGNLSIEYNGDAYLNFTDAGALSKKYGEKYKISTNIVNAGFQVYGQDATVMIWLINDKGEFLYVDILQHGTTTLELKNVKNLKNVVNVSTMYNGEAFIPVVIDIEGNIFEIK